MTICALISLISVPSYEASNPDLGGGETNTTKPSSRAEVLAATPDDSAADMVTSDPGFNACSTGNYDSPDCQNAMTKMLAKMTQVHYDVVQDLQNVAVQLNGLDAQQGDGEKKIASINAAIYGTGTDDNPGLMTQLQTVAQSLQDIQANVRDQATDIANKSSSVRAATELKIQNVKKVMDVKLAEVEKQINDLLDAQASAQQQTIVNAATNMLKATSQASTAISANGASIRAGQAALSDAVDEFENSAKTDLGQVAQETEENVSNLSQIQATASESLDQMNSAMTSAAKTAVATALSDSQDILAANLNSTTQSLNEVKTQASQDLAQAGSALSSDVQQSRADIQASFDATAQRMQQTNEDNRNGIASFSSTATAGVTALGQAQEASGQRLLSDAKDTQDEMSKVSQMISDYDKTGRDSLASIQGNVNSLVTPMQQAVGDKLSKQGQASGSELLRLNSAIADLLKRIGLNGNDALGALAAYMSDVQSRAGDDAKYQEGTLADTQGAIQTASDLANAKLKLQSDQADGTLGQLASTLGGSIDDAAATLNDVTVANGARQRTIQSQYQQQITAKQGDLNRRINDAKMAQQQGFHSLQAEQAQKGQDLAGLIADLMNVLDNVNGASQASGSQIADLQANLNMTQGAADTEIARLMNLIDGSQSAASAGASGAEAKLNFAMSGMGDQLANALKGYTGQFSGDLSDAIQKLTGMSNDTLSKLMASGALQTNASSDADALAKQLLTDLSQLSSSGQSSSDALATLFRSQAMQAALARQVKLKAIMDGAQGKMGTLEQQANDMIDQQSSGLAASTSQSVSTQQQRLAALVDALRAQQIGATSLASQTQGAVQKVQKWTGDLSSQIDTAKAKVGQSKQVQLGIIQALQNELNDWSTTVDKNISEAKQQLQDGMALIPNVTATKAADTERIFAASNDNMRDYLAKLKAAFDKMRATESDYVRQQSLRRLSTLMGIDRASLDNSNVLMQLLGVTDLSQIGDATQISTVLAGLADGVSALQGKDASAFASLKDRVAHLDANSKGLFGQLMNQAGGSLSDLYSKYAEDQHALQATIEAAADKDKVRAQALGDALDGMLGSIRNGSLVLNSQLANDRKDVYAVDGSVRQLGDESMIALSRLLHSVEGQSTAADSALANAQRANADRVASVRDVVISFVTAMQDYVDGSRTGFDDIHTKLDKYKDFLDKKLTVSDSYMLGMAQSTQSELSATAELAQALETRIEAFNARAKQQLFNVEEERSAIEARHEDELNLLRGKLQNATQQVQADQDAMGKQVDAWLAEEDVDLGFGAAEGAPKASQPAAISDAAEAVPATPDWASDDQPAFPASSFVQQKTVSKHDALVTDIQRNLRAIHREARSIGISV